MHFSRVKVADIAKLASGDKPELRVIGAFDTKRIAEFPDVPTLGELGYYSNWYGSARVIMAPRALRAT